MKHIYIYAIFSSLKRENEMNIDRRCLVKFSIGKLYQDKIWYDMIMMDACHLLLGRPCWYNRNAFHDGKNNTHTF